MPGALPTALFKHKAANHGDKQGRRNVRPKQAVGSYLFAVYDGNLVFNRAHLQYSPRFISFSSCMCHRKHKSTEWIKMWPICHVSASQHLGNQLQS